jgi:L-rhamnose mutarotase
MQRGLGAWRIFPGREDELDHRLASLPHALRTALSACGLRDVTVFRRGTDAWLYARADPDRDSAMSMLRADRAFATWMADLRDVVVDAESPDGGLAWYDEVFHTDGETLPGPSERGLFSLVIDPRHADRYDALHASPWPDMIAAIDEAGYRDYSGFRRGAHVVYVGRYHPDMATVLLRIGETDVAARWGQALTGVIVAITDDRGRHFTGHEVFHQD